MSNSTITTRAGGTSSAASSMHRPRSAVADGPNWSGKLPDGFVGADIVQSQSRLCRGTGTCSSHRRYGGRGPDRQRHTGPHHDHVAQPVDCLLERKEVRAKDVPLTKADYPTYPGMEKVREPGKLTGVDFLRWVSRMDEIPVSPDGPIAIVK